MTNQMQRFLDIIERNKTKEHVLAFIGLGSMHHTDRLDAYSDIDFFMIVKDGFKEQHLTSIQWLDVHPIIFWYRETKDGLKVIYDDGILLEFAVFTLDELKNIPYEQGTIYYQKEAIDPSLFKPRITPRPAMKKDESIANWLSNLYVGLLREHRGEHVAAFLMIQVYAAHHFLSLINPNPDDPFVVERRIESRLQISYDMLYPGIRGNKDSVRYQINHLFERFNLNVQMVNKIKELL